MAGGSNIIQRILTDLASTIRKLTAVIFIIFTAGMFAGAHAVRVLNSDQVWFVYLVPVLLALLSWLYTEVAVVIFILFVIFVFLL